MNFLHYFTTIVFVNKKTPPPSTKRGCYENKSGGVLLSLGGTGFPACEPA
jgi:hypothetical protein